LRFSHDSVVLILQSNQVSSNEGEMFPPQDLPTRDLFASKLNEKVLNSSRCSDVTKTFLSERTLLSDSVSASLDVTMESTALRKNRKSAGKLLFHQLNYSFDAFFQRWDQRVSLVLALAVSLDAR
jgi:hypothetical protein